ncbi:MAG TPA: TaqI-like C-terminal specificity domain-containing protein, partial [Spirochaetota bacterium]|nr:TaqI-like C-terminal specificity domain-containing protein [Spirochaetota bacterium]
DKGGRGDYKLTIEEKQKILINNIYGVDIDPQAVEVTKLSLYLKLLENEGKEAEGFLFKHSDIKLLPTLDKNIKCGNSLIGSDFYKDKDLTLFGNDEMRKVNVFDWDKEFPEVFRKREKKVEPFHITWVTHNSRASERMVEYKVKTGESFIFTDEEEIKITEIIKDIVQEEKYKILAYNICKDHIHLLLVCELSELSNIVKVIKGKSSVLFKKYLNIPNNEEFHLWAQKFDTGEIKDDNRLSNTINYIESNRIKHQLSENKGLKPLVPLMLSSYDEAFDQYEPGGFDVAIGNPPWVQSKAFEEDYKRYYSKRYKTTSKQYDLFCLFTEKSIEILNKNGIHSFIIPSRFFTNEDYYNYRKFILYYSGIKEIFDVGEHIFQKVEMPSCIYILTKEKENIIKLKYISGHYLDNRISENSVNLQDVLEDKNLFFKVSSDNAFFSICQKIQKNGTELLNFVTNARGVEIGKDSEVILRVENENPFLIGENVSRYNISFTDLYINANNKNIDYKTKELYTGEKILLRKTGHGINATLDIDNYWVIQVIYIFKKRENIPENIRYILAIINSKVIYHYYYEIFGEKNKKVFPHFRQTQFLQLPIRKIDFSNPIEKGRHDQLVSLVDQMLETQKLFHNAKSESDKKIYAQKIEMIDNRIDRLVYELYGLTEEEIKIAEGGDRRCE